MVHNGSLVIWINVTANPTAECIAWQTTKAFPWDGAPRYAPITIASGLIGLCTRTRRLLSLFSDPAS
jgi:hypothetical protein